MAALSSRDRLAIVSLIVISISLVGGQILTPIAAWRLTTTVLFISIFWRILRQNHTMLTQNQITLAQGQETLDHLLLIEQERLSLMHDLTTLMTDSAREIEQRQARLLRDVAAQAAQRTQNVVVGLTQLNDKLDQTAQHLAENTAMTDTIAKTHDVLVEKLTALSDKKDGV